MAEAAEELELQAASRRPECSSAAGSTQADVDGDLQVAGKPLPLKCAHAAPASSSSPGSSPGIQAVHVHGTPHSSSSSPSAVAALQRDGEKSSLPSPEQRREAVSVEPASLPSSPFASRAVQSQPLRHTSTGSGDAPASRRLSGSEALQQQAQPPACSAVTAAVGEGQRQCAQQTQQPQQAQQVQEAQQQPAQQVQPRQPSEEDEDEDVYARFSSYDEMAAHFRRLAADGQQQQPGGEGEVLPVAEEQQAGPSLPGGGARCGSLPRGLNEPDLTVTAASSFSGGASGVLLLVAGRERRNPTGCVPPRPPPSNSRLHCSCISTKAAYFTLHHCSLLPFSICRRAQQQRLHARGLLD